MTSVRGQEQWAQRPAPALALLSHERPAFAAELEEMVAIKMENERLKTEMEKKVLLKVAQLLLRKKKQNQ